MDNELINAFESPTYFAPESNMSLTQNAAPNFKSSGSAVLDLFSKAGGMRGKDEDFFRAFAAAWAEDPDLTLKCLFYIRDIRGGLGERHNFRIAFRQLAMQYPQVALNMLNLVPEYGRWDDLLHTLESDLAGPVMTLFGEQLKADVANAHAGKPITLLAKWLPSENASSPQSKYWAREIAKYLQMTPRQYRKLLSFLRAKLNVVERNMSAQDWTGINYSQVPSQAMRIYRKAFERHDPGFAEFLEKVEKGEVEIQAGTLAPHQLVSTYTKNATYNEDPTIEALWKALPNHMNGKSLLVVADVSGSMTWTGPPMPIDVSVALAIYAAERNTGPFANRFITFSSTPRWLPIDDGSLLSKVNQVRKGEWGGSTDVEAVFKMILKTAYQNRVAAEHMPEIIVIVSDMQFNQGAGGMTFTNHEAIKAMYRKIGYTAPTLVYWNVDDKGGQPVEMHESGAILVSGFQASVFKGLLNADLDSIDPYNYMLEVLNSERYAPISM